MNNYNFDGHQDGDWEERGDLSWNEFDWQLFLKRQQKEVSKFLTLYNEFVQDGNRLDTVAIKMGWDIQDWSLSDNSEEDEDSSLEEESFLDREDPFDPLDLDPYTLHRHPVFVVLTALYADLHRLCEHLLVRTQQPTPTNILWRFARSLSDGERNGILGLQALDMADFMLAVCHFKLVLRAINESMSMVETLCQTADTPSSYHAALCTRLFDLREVCLRVMSDCREEDRRGFREEN